jgi:hypothetical protein
MTKCEQAQKGIDELIQRMENLCKDALDATKMPETPKESISIKIRVCIVQIERSVVHYANHLQGLKD